MAKPRVFISRAIPDQGLDLLTEECDAEVWSKELPPTRKELLKKVSGMEGVLSYGCSW
jgi:hypothetical protein